MLERIKKIKNDFDGSCVEEVKVTMVHKYIDDDGAFRGELRILELLPKSQYLLRLCCVVPPRSLLFTKMQYDLRHRIQRIPEPYNVDSYAFQIAMGLETLHHAKIIHGDLKPMNILVDWDGTLKICDFGLSCLSTDDDGTKAQKTTGGFGAPELLNEMGNIITFQTDIWAYGCLYYYMMHKEQILDSTLKASEMRKQTEEIDFRAHQPEEIALCFKQNQWERPTIGAIIRYLLTKQ